MVFLHWKSAYLSLISFQFHEKFLSSNEAGGKNVANEIYARVKDYSKEFSNNPGGMDIIVRAYANLKGLGPACVKMGKMKGSASMSSFAQGFTQSHGLFDFVDVGPGKERADNKIRGMFGQFL